MIAWIFAGATLSAAILATFLLQLKRAILALWVAGLGVAAIYLTVGAEFLAIIQCIVSTLVTISFIFFSVLFGEFQPVKRQKVGNEFLLTSLALILGCTFIVVIWLGTQSFPEMAMVPVSETDLSQLGIKLTQDYLLSLEVLALILFLVLVGGGVIARMERNDEVK